MFDIDHLYLARYNINEDGGFEFEEGSNEALQNQILDCILTVLKDSRTPNIGFKSIDNDTSLVESVAAEIPEEGNTKSVAFNFGTLHEQVTRKNDYITGKIGIGPFALNVTNHILTTLYGVKFKENSFTALTGITGFDKVLDKKDNQISSWLSAFINAHVDIVKDPYISKLNVNSFTYNMINLLARNGKGEAGLYFLCQPIIRQMAKADNDAKSQFTRNPHIYRSAFDMRSLIIENVFPDVCGIGVNDDAIKAVIEDTSAGSLTRKAQIVNDVLNNIDMLQRIAKDPNGFGKTDEAKAFQVKCYEAWMVLDKYANALNHLVQYTKIDTRKQGKNFIEMLNYLNNYNDLVNPTNPEESIFNMDTIYDLVDLSWIDLKTKAAIYYPIDVMRGQSFQGTNEFNIKVGDIAFDLSMSIKGKDRRLYTNSKAMRKISLACSTAIKTKYFIELADRLGIDTKGLFEGNHTIFDRLNMLLACITRDLGGLSRLKDNYLLRHLAPYLTDPNVFNAGKLVQKPKFLQVLNSMDDSKMSADMFIEAWEELLNDSVKNVRNFARDLIFYAMFTSGDTKGFNKLGKYVPISYLTLKPLDEFSSFTDYISSQLQHPEIDIDAIAQNNMMDSDLIGRATYNDFWYANTGFNRPSVLISKEIKSTEEAPLYVAVRYKCSKYNDVTSYNLYKRVGTVLVEGDVKLVYAMLPKKGWTEKAGLSIYEYGDIGLSVNSTSVTENSVRTQLEALDKFLREIQPSFTERDIIGELKNYDLAYTTPHKQMLVEPADPEKAKALVKDSGTSKDGQTVYISRQYYYKGQPQKHPNVQYVFTENYQAAAAVHGWRLDGSYFQHPKLNVGSGKNGTNQACIRTDGNGNLSHNAYGLIVKAFQQDAQGRFVNNTTACIANSPEWIQAFKNINDYILRSIDKNKPVVFPATIALGKAGLPMECAKWLRKELLDRYNIVSEVEPNLNPGYIGTYGVEIKGVTSTEEAQKLQAEEILKQALAQAGFNEQDMQQAKDITNHCKGGK